MDYRYIEQLLERYWQCETSLDEEAQLRNFFLNEEVPTSLLPYKDLFVYQNRQLQAGLSDDFDKRMLNLIAQETPVVKAKKMTLLTKLSPLFRAAAMVAIVILSGTLMQRSLTTADAPDYNYDSYNDTYSDPEAAYQKISSALMMLSEGINKSEEQHLTDSLSVGEIEK